MRARSSPIVRLAFVAALLPPLADSRGLTSGFGEYRDARFHAGIDYSTDSRIGAPVRAIGDGHVARVRASGVGYGNAIYLALDDGRMGVYGHLSRFAPALAAWVEAKQDSSGRYEQDLEPPPALFRFRRGDVIAWSGESGAGPPHLHLEVRRGDMNLHPLRQGIAVRDATPPTISAVTIVPAGPRAHVGGSVDPWRGAFRGAGEIVAPVVVGPFRLALDTYDRSADLPNHIGTYRLRVLLDGQPAFESVLDSVAWADMAIADRVYDLAATQAGMNDRRLLQATPGDATGLVRLGVPVWSLEKGDHRLEFVAEDEAGNRTSRTLRVTVDGTADSTGTARAPRVTPRLLAAARSGAPAIEARDVVVFVAARAGDARPPLEAWGSGLELLDSLVVGTGTVWSLAATASAPATAGLPQVVRGGRDPGWATLSGGGSAAHEVTLAWDSLAFHEPAALVVTEEAVAGGVETGRIPASGSVAAVTVGPDDLALARALRIGWRGPVAPGIDPAKVGLFRRTARGGYSLMTTRDSSGAWSTTTRRLGTFALLADTTAPRLVPPRRYAPRAGAAPPAFSVRIADPGSGIAAADQRVLFDGRAVPAEYDPEAGRLTWRPRAPFSAGAHAIVVEAVDRLGNRASVRVPVEVR